MDVRPTQRRVFGRGHVAQAFLYSRGSGDVRARADRYGFDSEFVVPNGAFREVPVEQAKTGDRGTADAAHATADRDGAPRRAVDWH